jgi:hypothetical protein
MTLRISSFTQYPLTREEARQILSSLPVRPDAIDFSDLRSISHCFAHELFSTLRDFRPQILNAAPFVENIVSSVTTA